MTKSTLVAGKAAVTTSKWSPGKGKDAKGPNPYSPIPRKPADEKKKLPQHYTFGKYQWHTIWLGI